MMCNMIEDKPLLKLSNITFCYPQADTPLLKDISLSVAKGEIVALSGPSGIGKSTLIRICLGLRPAGSALSGSVLYEGKELLGCSEKQWLQYRGVHLGWMTQAVATALTSYVASEKQIIPVLCRLRPYSTQEARRRLYNELDALGVADPALLLRQRWNTLSGGQRRLVLLSLWLTIRPALLFLDEPSAGLDAAYRNSLASRLRKERDELGQTFFIVTHDRTFAMKAVDRLLTFRNGMLENTPTVCENAIPPPAALMQEVFSAPPQKPLLRVVGLRKTFGVNGGKDLTVLDGFNLSVWPGGVSLLWGRSGSGKTTAARCALRLQGMDDGSIFFRDLDVSCAGASELSLLRQHMQMVEQDAHSTIDPKWSVRKIVSEGLRHFGISRAEEKRRTEMWMERLGLPLTLLDYPGGALSIGQAQRVALVRAFALQPALLALDEPSANLDAKSRRLLSISIREYLASGERGILLISHDEDFIQDLNGVIVRCYTVAGR